MQSAISYLRVSTGRQGKSGLGLEAQRDAIAHFAKSQGFDIIAEHVEVETGKGADALDRRPKLATALAQAKRARAPVIVCQTMPPVSRRSLYIRSNGAQGALHRRRTRGRRRSLHASHLCGSR